jgi:chromosome segregation protein
VRLKQIKLSGFKSFVDPTAFDVPGRLVAIVGPNGCGKSNIIDAVRWVLGESKASELRGESMQDVIFSGSLDRKASARASVELVFDNSLGRIGGAWGQYAELSVRRVLGRDGQSIYSINQQIVRRRDVHDLFLGTGLGPRAYAIIGQGTISRIIESRPEELRIFLEEAAGISRYRERRRETEGRLSDTRENLTRVEDILRELNAQIAKLELQAEVAARFRELESERDARSRMLWILRRDEARGEQARAAGKVLALQTDIESAVARLRQVEADLEAIRSQHYAAGDEVHAAQGKLYDANAEVARLESDIRVVAQTQGQLRERLESLALQAQRAEVQLRLADSEREAATERLETQRMQSEESAEVAAQLAESFPDTESAARQVRQELDVARAVAGEARQAIELSAVQTRNAQTRLDALHVRRERLRSELASLVETDPAELQGEREALAAAEELETSQQLRLEELQQRWQGLDSARAPAQQGLREAEARSARVEARIAALKQLQSRMESQSRIQPWLSRHGLEKLSRLTPKLRIEAGWENAFEAVLRERVNALELGSFGLLGSLAGDAPPAKVAFFSSGLHLRAVAAPPAGLRPLASLAHCTDAGIQALLSEALAHCMVAESMDDALRDRERLPEGACFVVREGHQVGRSLISFYAADSEEEGLLARLQEIDNLTKEQRAQQLLVDDARALMVRTESGAMQAQAELVALREEHARELRHLSALRVRVNTLEQELSRVAGSRERIEAELNEIAEESGRLEETLEELAAQFETLDLRLGEAQQRAEELQFALEEAEAARERSREQLRQAEKNAAEADFSVRATESEIERLRAASDTAREQQQSAVDERGLIDQRLAEITDAEARESLQAALTVRSAAESALTASRERLDDLSQRLRSLEEGKLSFEREQEPLRQKLIDLQLQEQAARLSAEQFEGQLAEVALDAQAEAELRERFGAADLKPSWLQGEVTRLANAIAALGAVNLAALDELTQSRERQGFLQAQMDDLNEAITTLEDAIRKIDRETRELLRETFDTVNRHFGELFPRLFGGGEARLILTGDEILDAGVQVMAQPPGKRNTSIHLLSGGEKALTAIALVFALFQLNPAPFCLLDEVDAPLDDSNTERYAQMVREMAGHTQFLFITHNKIAMEFAEQLIGVTMQEKGVSRIVAVDLEAAARLAEAA